jgi:hypothetical protein
MKASKPAKAPQASVFPTFMHKLRTKPAPPVLGEKSKKRDNIFSQSKDLREDRGERQIKTKTNAQTFRHGK